MTTADFWTLNERSIVSLSKLFDLNDFRILLYHAGDFHPDLETNEFSQVLSF